jgi:hypothetical protein
MKAEKFASQPLSERTELPGHVKKADYRRVFLNIIDQKKVGQAAVVRPNAYVITGAESVNADISLAGAGVPTIRSRWIRRGNSCSIDRV